MVSRLVHLLDPADAHTATAAELAARIRALVLDGRLTVGEKLPSERALAQELRRSRSTITRAYDTLEAGRYVERLHGGGTRIALPHAESTTVLPAADDAIDLSIASMGSTPGLYEATERALPRLAALRGTSGYSVRGLLDLREAVAQRFSERGAPTSPGQIVITAGAMQALNLVLATIGRPGRRALIEQPTFPHAVEAIQRQGYRPLPTPVHAWGWDLDHLHDSLLRERPDIAYLIPDFQNPTGASLADAERDTLAATARSAGTTLIVDETTAELDIDRGWTPRPMAAFGPCITLGSMSKLAWGGLRIGWIRAEQPMVARILGTRVSFDLGTALLEQCIAVELLDELPSLRAHARDRLLAGRAAVVDGLGGVEGIEVPVPAGGLSTWVDLGAPVSTALSLAARERGVILPPGPRFAVSGVLERWLRVPITIPPPQASEAISRLRLAWRDVADGVASPFSDLVHTAVV